MNTALHYHLAGMGAAADTAVSVGSTIAQTVAPAVLTHTAIGATVAASLGGAALAIPIVGAALAGISLGIEAILHSGCGQTCIVTSQWANQAGAQLDKNIAAYFAITPPRPKSVQQLALANFQAVWNTLVQQCSQAGLGDAGKNCISARQAGACHWKAAPPAYPGEPATGTCWNWWNAYYDPIANDTNVYDDSATSALSSAGSGITSAISNLFGGGSNSFLLLGGALFAAALLTEYL